MAKAKLTLDKLFEGTFLVDLLTAKDNCPNEHVSRGEEVIGEMTAVERKLYGLLAQYGKLGGGIALKLEYDSLSDDESVLLEVAGRELKSKLKALRQLMWVLIKERLVEELGAEFSVGVRADFEIVRFIDNRKQNEPPEFIKKLVGDILDRR